MLQKALINSFFFLSPFLIFSNEGYSEKNINVSTERLKRHIEVLGSDLFEGRGTGTKGSNFAESYISDVFKSIELLPIGDNGTYLQSVPMHGTNFLPESKLIIYSDNNSWDLKIGKDYLLSNSGEQTYIPTALDLVFVDYGIIAPEFDHNDYLEKDISGKIAVMLDGEPDSDDEEYFNGDEPTIYSYYDVKHRIAISRGAAGTIIIPNIEVNDTSSWNKLVREYSFEDVRLLYNASNSFGIILNPSIARELFCQTNKLEAALSCNNVKTDHYSLEFEGEFFLRDFRANNVVGMIKGKDFDDNDEYIIVSAHYDHLGIGPAINGDRIYNGVLDNAVGVSGLIEVARSLKKNEIELERSVIFIATTGEEKGLLGSTYYVDHPIVPLYKTVANINIDGLAFIDEFKSIIGIGSELSNLGNYLKKTADKFGYGVEEIPREFYSHESFNRSDQISFAKAGIPSILILDAPDYLHITREEAIEKIIYFNNTVYHTPFDDLSISLNYDAMRMHVEFIVNYLLELSNGKISIEWNENVPYNYLRLQTIAEKR